jgi:hypothetical protein
MMTKIAQFVQNVLAGCIQFTLMENNGLNVVCVLIWLEMIKEELLRCEVHRNT